MEDDLQLIEQFRHGDEKAFETLVKKYQSRVFHMIYGFTRDPQEIEDYAQDIFIRIFQGLQKFNQEAQFSTWLQRVTINYCIDESRKKRKRWFVPFDEIQNLFSTSEPNSDKNDLTPIQKLEEKERKMIIQQAIGKLSPEHQAIITLREIQDEPYEEIARILRLSVGTVKSRLWRARKVLQKILKPYAKS